MTYHPDEKLVIAHTAESASEAMVIRGLLEYAGIHALASATSDPFPLNEPLEGSQDTEIFVRESQLAEAKKIISDAAKGNAAAADTSS
jgi:hypothetical protein